MDFIFLWPSWQLHRHGHLQRLANKQTSLKVLQLIKFWCLHCMRIRTHTHTNKQTDRQTDKKTNKQTNKHTNTQTCTHTHALHFALPCTSFLRKQGSTRQCSNKWPHIGCTARFQGRIPKAPVTSPEAASGLHFCGLGTALWNLLS
jgi:hypothetical protein